MLNVDRGVPEVWCSTYDVRDLLNATVKLRYGEPLTQMKLGITRNQVYGILNSQKYQHFFEFVTIAERK